MNLFAKNNQQGFNLIEVIAALMIASILGSVMYAYFASSVVDSQVTVRRLKKAMELHAVMENITADYMANYNYPIWQPSTLYAVGDIVVPTKKNLHFYRCIVAGLSDITEPAAWTTITGGLVPETFVTWQEDGGLKNKIGNESTTQNNSYGKYDVVKNRFIGFDASNAEIDVVAPEEILKVIIKNEGGTLTALFPIEK